MGDQGKGPSEAERFVTLSKAAEILEKKASLLREFASGRSSSDFAEMLLCNEKTFSAVIENYSNIAGGCFSGLRVTLGEEEPDFLEEDRWLVNIVQWFALDDGDAETNRISFDPTSKRDVHSMHSLGWVLIGLTWMLRGYDDEDDDGR